MQGRRLQLFQRGSDTPPQGMCRGGGGGGGPPLSPPSPTSSHSSPPLPSTAASASLLPAGRHLGGSDMDLCPPSPQDRLCAEEASHRAALLRRESLQRCAIAETCVDEEGVLQTPSPISSTGSHTTSPGGASPGRHHHHRPPSSNLLLDCFASCSGFEAFPPPGCGSSSSSSSASCLPPPYDDDGYESDGEECPPCTSGRALPEGAALRGLGTGGEGCSGHRGLLQMPFPAPEDRASTSFDISSDFASDRQRGGGPSTPDAACRMPLGGGAMQCEAVRREVVAVSNGPHLAPLAVPVAVSESEQAATLPWVSMHGRSFAEECLPEALEDGDTSPDARHDERSLQVPLASWLRLYPHQKEGVAWLWKQTCEAATDRAAGGILGDEMGLGKTIQLLTFLSAALRCGYGRTAMVVVPPSVVASWQSHQETWCPRMRLVTLTSDTPASLRARIVEGFREPHGPCVLLTTYGVVQSLFRRNDPLLAQVEWDYMVLDEGHLIKNPASQTARAVKALRSQVRFILTGTPIQNSLDELWALYSFVDTRIVGSSAAAFKRTFTDPIKKGMLRGASESVRELSERQGVRLRDCYAPYLLQRQKEDIAGLGLRKKIDVVVWCGMTDLQRRVYAGCLDGADVRECILRKEVAGAICKLTNLRKLCNHLWLQCSQDDLQNRLLVPTGDHEQGTIAGDCCKMEVLLKIYEEARDAGQRVLVFSQSVKMLNIISVVLRACCPEIQLLRLDGGTKAKDRQERVDRFNTDPSIDMMLLTTGVGGTGLTLTGASRVVIFDPDWNPAKDSQAIGRAHRIGQTEQVVVYRLLTCGSVEEFTYRQDIFKECVERKAARNHEIYRYFSKVELHAMFKFEPDSARTLNQLNTLQGVQVYPEDVRRVFGELCELGSVCGITDHDAVFSVHEEMEEDDLSCTLPAQSVRRAASLSRHSSGGSQSPLPKRSALSDITPNMTPAALPEALKTSHDASLERSTTPSATSAPPALHPLPPCALSSPDVTLSAQVRAPSHSSSCGEMPRDKDDEGMLRAAEEAFSRMSSPSPSGFPLGYAAAARPVPLLPHRLPPRHASKSPGVRLSVEKCSNCDYAQFPYCPVTGRAHKKQPESSERGESVSRLPGYSPPLHPPRIEAIVQTEDVDETMADSGQEVVYRVDHREGRALSFSAVTDSSLSSVPAAPSAPCKMRQRQSTHSVGSAQRELSFGMSSHASVRAASVSSAPDAPYKYRETTSTFSVGSVQRDLLFGCSMAPDVYDESLVLCDAPSPAHTGYPQYEVHSTHSVTVREVSFSSATNAPCKFRDTVGAAAGTPSLGMRRSGSAPDAPCKVETTSTVSFGAAQRGLSMASVTSYTSGETPNATLQFCSSDMDSVTHARSTSPPHLQLLLQAPERPLRETGESNGVPGSARRELSFGAGSHGHESFATCRSQQSPMSWHNETPQGACTQSGPPGAPCRGGVSSQGRCCSVGSAFVSPVTHVGVRRRIRETRCSDSETSISSIGQSHYYDDADMQMDRSVSGSTEDSLRIRHSVNIYTPPPL